MTAAADENGESLSVGRKTRVVPTAIKRALWARDKGCRFPGCGRKRYVDAHHNEHWSAGGETSLENLMLLGRAVPACGYRLEDMSDDDADAEGEYLHSQPSAEGYLSDL